MERSFFFGYHNFLLGVGVQICKGTLLFGFLVGFPGVLLGTARNTRGHGLHQQVVTAHIGIRQSRYSPLLLQLYFHNTQFPTYLLRAGLPVLFTYF